MATFRNRVLLPTLLFIGNHRIAFRVIVLIGVILTIADAFVFERSEIHTLVGHTAIGLGLAAMLLLVESADEPRTED
ncbi:MAG: hypothetical protein IT472_06855 [Thermomonas sp.]|uniref:hypothetical protein n=1 Tax=Thermomonas sp. TaxID=1971895 RepID=UPI0026075217|nr:hypothetical protein [Thermomonas sp.]MBK8069401.1 hypothetical protein [Rhodanobacteraceae bacterium]MBV6413489.1 hypothetical protein [Xanthomonadales bacterium]MCC7096877.1 hypothetical protein [Thermomonas sp.]